MPDTLIVPASDVEIPASPITERTVVLSCPSGKAFAAYKAAEAALNSCRVDGAEYDALAEAYNQAQEEFLNKRDGTTLGAAIKLRLIADVENLDGYLAESPNLLWPRMVKRLIADLSQAAGMPETLSAAASTSADPAELLWQLDRQASAAYYNAGEAGLGPEMERQSTVSAALERALAAHPTTTHLGILRKLELFAEIEGQEVPARKPDELSLGEQIIASLISDLRALLGIPNVTTDYPS
ncbi:hypothetical protein [Reyranella soli]|uniref:Uncharacterized protein n=1 Tax=Reyranella soli TaxID=1230389 RepID=A0A512NKM8_9HYPH|nr:hypothetical protein [Reyranella soli]GEP59501.1 hypothetical protein RSO01_66670 [Reyranella soli]